jgi:hypothetical protein
VTGHPDREVHELVFVADLTVELRAWPCDTWAKVGFDPLAAAAAVVAGWRPVEPAPAERTVIFMLALSLIRAADQAGEIGCGTWLRWRAPRARRVPATRCRVGC